MNCIKPILQISKIFCPFLFVVLLAIGSQAITPKCNDSLQSSRPDKLNQSSRPFHLEIHQNFQFIGPEFREQSNWPSEIEIRVFSTPSNEIPSNPFYREQFQDLQIRSTLDEKVLVDFLTSYFEVNRELVQEVLRTNKLKIIGDGWQSIHKLLPLFMQRRAGKFACAEGINCWNTALRYYHKAFIPFYTPRWLALQKLKSDFNPIDISRDKIRFGDLLVFWDQYTNELLHFAIFVGGSLVFQKGSLDRRSPYEISRFGPQGYLTYAGGISANVSVHRLKKYK